MKILGINSVYHETAAAIIIDGKVVSAVEEERFNRYKHGAEARPENPDEYPLKSIFHCLKQGRVKVEELDAICYSYSPKLREKEYKADPYSIEGGWGHLESEKTFHAALSKVPETLSEALQTDISDRFHWVPHHLAHAASTYYPSSFAKAGILVVDGIGEYSTAMLAYGEGNKIKTLKTIYFPDSLGFLWQRMSKFLGFSNYDACKVMGLASYGNPLKYQKEFSQIIQLGEDGSFSIAGDTIQFRRKDFESLVSVFGSLNDGDTVLSPEKSDLNQKHKDIAATLQDITNQVMLSLANWIYKQYPCDALCIAGGVGLNCQSNWIVKEKSPYQHIYIPTAAHDAGTAIGAALYHYYHIKFPNGSDYANSHVKSKIMPNPYLGPSFSDREIEQILTAKNIQARKSENVEAEAAQFIAGGKIVGWFQGKLEFGPRALGNRSLLADPRDRNIREVMNTKVKHREVFRPFAPSVMEEKSHEWFELGKPSESLYYMLFACPVLSDKLDKIPAVLHVDNTARVQLVNRDMNPKYHKLIEEFEAITGVPIVLNTSFNDSEPIVCTPEDALATFFKTRIDVLVLGNYVIER